MNRLMRRGLIVGAALFLVGAALPARADGVGDVRSNLPIVPMNVRFQYVPQYFAEIIGNDQRYGSIEALIDNDSLQPWYEVVLTDRTTGRRIFYLNSLEGVTILRAEGTIAHYAAITFTPVERPDANPTYRIGLSDSYGQDIVWTFIVNPRITEAETRFTSPLAASGFVIMHASRRLAAAQGTMVTIGKETEAANLSGSPDGRESVSYQAFAAKDLVVAEIAPGTQPWLVDSSPAQLSEGAEWTVHTNGAPPRQITIERISGDQMQIRQVEPDNPFSSPAQLDVLRQNNGFALRSILFARQSHTLRISFEPSLPLPAVGLEDSTDAQFSVGEDNTPIAHGKVSVARTLATEHVSWWFSAPNWARTSTFDSGVNLFY